MNARPIALLPLLLLLGCPPTTPDTGPDPVEEPTPAPWEPPPVARCGMEPYELLEPGAVEVLALEEAPEWNLVGGTIDFFLMGGGVDLPAPASWDAATWRIRYTTQDRGQPAEATALISLPGGEAALSSGQSWPVLVVEHGFTGIGPACPASEDAGWPLMAAFFASRGYAVVAPDYLGLVGIGDVEGTPPHGALVMEQTAIATWDAVRALRALADGPLRPDLPGGLQEGVLLWGASQGGHAALSSARWQPWVAPEEPIRGVVSTVPPMDVVAAVGDALTELGGGTALALQAMISMQRWYGVPDDLRSMLTDEDPTFYATQVEAALSDPSVCGGDVSPVPEAFEELFTADFLDGLRSTDEADGQPWRCFLQEASLADTSVPQRGAFPPTLLIFGELDDAVHPRSMDEAFDRLCAEGLPLQHLECQGAGHVEGPLWSLREQLSWMEARLDGVPVPESDLCARHAPTVCSGTPEPE